MSDPAEHRMLQALRRQATDRTPVWLMRQAGRYLPEYRATRARAGDFMALCRSPELCTEVALQPLERFDLDAAILFSDILTIPDAMGLGLHFEADAGPRFDNPVRTATAVEALPIPDAETELGYVMDAVRALRRALDERVPLIGFAGSPWTLACYMVEGGSSSDFARIKTMAAEYPDALHLLLDKLAIAVADYLSAQVCAGAQILQIFDTWGGVLSTHQYREFSLAYMQKVLDSVSRTDAKGTQVPTILFTRGGGQWLEAMIATGCECLSLDWTTDIGSARARAAGRVALQGNLDPGLLRAPPQRIRQEVKFILDRHGPAPGHIFNLGHGIAPDIHPDRVKVMVDAVHEFSERPAGGE